jgi:hypothetical protein
MSDSVSPARDLKEEGWSTTYGFTCGEDGIVDGCVCACLDCGAATGEPALKRADGDLKQPDKTRGGRLQETPPFGLIGSLEGRVGQPPAERPFADPYGFGSRQNRRLRHERGDRHPPPKLQRCIGPRGTEGRFGLCVQLTLVVSGHYPVSSGQFAQAAAQGERACRFIKIAPQRGNSCVPLRVSRGVMHIIYAHHHPDRPWLGKDQGGMVWLLYMVLYMEPWPAGSRHSLRSATKAA